MKGGYSAEDRVGVEFSRRVVGKQTINRAEAMAVLNALLITRLDHGIHMYIDSQVTIDSMNKLWHGTTGLHKVQKKMANFSIFNTITQLRRQLWGSGGFSIHLHKVKSHQKRYKGVFWSDIADDGPRYNTRADELAEIGLGAALGCKEAWHNCAPAVLVIDGVLEEAASYNKIYHAVDAGVLRHMRGLKNASPKLKIYDMEGVWHDASRHKITQFDPKGIFLFNLLFRNLHTPRNIQIINPHIPKIYPGHKCPLCRRN